MESFVLIAGVATFINFAVIYWKTMNGRIVSATIDGAVLFTAGFIFMGTMAGMSIAMVASSLFSLFLAIFPPSWEKKVNSVKRSRRR